MLVLINVTLYIFGCMTASLISDAVKMRKLNKKIKAYRDEEVKAMTQKIERIIE